ncbi:MAG: 50S ribosomal protein L29 [Pseudomonadota bacterium]|nr:50S ribosomal protein L29 [Pseudomonadota bacterium]|tara:strand:- start:600 stop:794 length:195 start_codon:yes stop_codon:yes gene_type:complete
MNKTKELREMSGTDLQQKLEKNLHEILDMRLQLKQGKDVKVHKFSLLKREVARIKTLLGERENG